MTDLHEQWLEEWNAACCAAGDGSKEASSRANALHNQMMKAPAVTPAGVLAKIRAALWGGGVIEDLDEEVELYPDGSGAMLLSAIHDLERMAGDDDGEAAS